MQLASNAILNAIWDLWAKVEGRPLWRLVAEMTPEQLVGVVDFRYITDELTPEQALAMLKEQEKTKKERLELALQNKVGKRCTRQGCVLTHVRRRYQGTTPVWGGWVCQTQRLRLGCKRRSKPGSSISSSRSAKA